MLYRTSDNKIIELKRYNYTNDKSFYKDIIKYKKEKKEKNDKKEKKTEHTMDDIVLFIKRGWITSPQTPSLI